MGTGEVHSPREGSHDPTPTTPLSGQQPRHEGLGFRRSRFPRLSRLELNRVSGPHAHFVNHFITNTA